MEGELTHLGVGRLPLDVTRFGVLFGPEIIGDSYYLHASLEFDLNIPNIIAFGVGTPIDIPAYIPSDGVKLFPEKFAVRAQDYATWQRGVRVIRYITAGQKESTFYVNASTDTAATIGHGAAIRRYSSNFNIDDSRLLTEVDVKLPFGGFESMVGNLVSPQDMIGALLWFRPMFAMDNLIARTLSFGLEYAGDLVAPLDISRGASGYPNLDLATDQMIPGKTAQVHIPGVSIEAKVVRTANIDVKPYVDFSQMIVSTPATRVEGNGVTLGTLGRFGLGPDGLQSAFRIVGELRLFQPNYMPGYFDTFYQVQRWQYITSASIAANATPTKLAVVMCRAPDREGCPYAGAPGWRGPREIPGFDLEVSYSLLKWIAFTAALTYAGDNLPGGSDLVLHVEVPTFSWLRFFVSAYRLNLNDASTARNASDWLFGSNTLVISGLRAKLAPVMFVDAQYVRAWILDTTSPANNFALENEVVVNLELGYEFSH